MKVRCSGCFEIYDNAFGLCPYCGHAPSAPAKEPYHLAPGSLLAGRYVIGNVLGFGGFGITYKAWDKKLEAVVAVKEYFPSGVVNRQPGSQKVVVLSSKSRREFDFGLVRIIEEARNMAQFNSNKNIVNVYEYFEENNTAYIIMEFLNGQPLSDYMQENGGILPFEQSIDIILNVASALKVIHSKSIIHRDISPDNIYLCKNGNIKLIDFGAAKFSVEQASNYTIILKPGFAPPEQYEQVSKQGPWTDIYALGATLYYMLTGRKPDESTNRKVGDTLPDPVKINPQIPQYISDAVMKAVAIESDLRFSSAEEFTKALRHETKVVPVKKERRKRKNKRIIGMASVFAVIAAAIIIFGIDMITRNNMAQLKPADIVVWYIDNGDKKQKEVYENIVSDFCDEYTNVDVELVGVSAEEYDEKLLRAIDEGEAPNVFVSSSFSDKELDDVYDITDVVFHEREFENSIISKIFADRSRTDCMYLENYEDISDGKRVPVGFNVPVVYVNKSKLASGAKLPEKIGSLKDIKKLIGEDEIIAVNPELEEEFEDVFNKKISGNIELSDKEKFLNGEAAIYFSDTSEYFETKNMTAQNKGIPLVLPLEEEIILYDSFWSVYESSSEDENEAAEEFLSFMLTETAQNEIYLKNQDVALPLNKDTMSAFTGTYGDLAFLAEKEKKFSLDI